MCGGKLMPITRRSFAFAALGGALLPAVPALPALAKAPFAGAQAPGVYRLKLGGFEITVLSDGTLPLETKIFSGDPAGAAKLLESAFLPKDAIVTSVNEWLVNTGDKLVLVDTGTSNVFAPTLGRMAGNLAAAGIDLATVDAIILTHMHPDHAAGLLTPDKKVAFANATVHVNEAEYAFWTSADNAAKAPADFKPFFELARNAIKPYADAGKVMMMRDGEVVPGISAMLAPGHTVGHTMLRLSSQGSDLLIWGDIVHTAALQFPEPDRALAFDTDMPMAIATRKRVFDMVVTDRLMIAGAHLPFPGLGHVARASAGYAYVPVPWGETL
jgi:glyoxylase-like metal-dependent hydrolase (beta-lactamase superfamily II)